MVLYALPVVASSEDGAETAGPAPRASVVAVAGSEDVAVSCEGGGASVASRGSGAWPVPVGDVSQKVNQWPCVTASGLAGAMPAGKMVKPNSSKVR